MKEHKMEGIFNLRFYITAEENHTPAPVVLLAAAPVAIATVPHHSASQVTSHYC